MPVRQRKPNEITQQMIPLLLLGIGLVTTNNSATFLDGESTILGAASNPLRKMFGLFFSGAGMRGQPPLYEIILHFWLRWTGGNFDFLRIPSVLFFLAGLFLLARACRHLAGSSSAGVAIIWVGVLWPVGFLFGRLATSDSFSFFLVAGLTLSYFKYLEDQTTSRWAAFFFFSFFLIWTSYFGWAVLLCLAIDQVIRRRAKEPSVTPKALLGTAALLFVSFLPLFPAFRSDLSKGIDLHQGALTILVSTAFHVFSLLVSEAVAPWYWRLSIPAGLAVLLSLGLVAWWVRGAARRLLFYSLAILAAIALLGMLQTQYLFMLSPWVLLSIGVAIDAAKPRWTTFALAAALLIFGAAGWYGIYSRRYYSAPQFIEPWQEVARDAAAKIKGGATVISDRPSFLFYLTYLLRVPSQNGPWSFQGLLPDSVRHPQVYSPAGWLGAGRPTSGKMILVRRGGDSGEDKPMDDAARELDQSCGSISTRLRVRDEGYKWKQRFSPQLGEPQWRIEIREYDCDSSNSKQIYPLPPR